MKKLLFFFFVALCVQGKASTLDDYYNPYMVEKSYIIENQYAYLVKIWNSSAFQASDSIPRFTDNRVVRERKFFVGNIPFTNEDLMKLDAGEHATQITYRITRYGYWPLFLKQGRSAIETTYETHDEKVRPILDPQVYEPKPLFSPVLFFVMIFTLFMAALAVKIDNKQKLGGNFIRACLGIGMILINLITLWTTFPFAIEIGEKTEDPGLTPLLQLSVEQIVLWMLSILIVKFLLSLKKEEGLTPQSTHA